jgi:hypothetical protein
VGPLLYGRQANWLEARVCVFPNLLAKEAKSQSSVLGRVATQLRVIWSSLTGN